MKPVYMIQREIVITTCVIVCSLVLEMDPTIRNNIDIVTMLASMKTKYMNNAAAVLRKLARK